MPPEGSGIEGVSKHCSNKGLMHLFFGGWGAGVQSGLRSQLGGP